MEYHPALRDVHPDHAFRLKDGPALKNLYDLERELRRINDAQFRHHVNDAKNDFYNWIYHIVKDEDLAMQLAQVREKDAMADVVERRIARLENHGKEPHVLHVGPTSPIKGTRTTEIVREPVKKTAPMKKIAAVKKSVPQAVTKKRIVTPQVSVRTIAKEHPLPKLPPARIMPEPPKAPLPLSFEEVQALIRSKIGEPVAPVIDDDYEPEPEPIVPTLPLHHRIHAHVKAHAVHYGWAIVGVLVGLMLAKLGMK
jgi:uncharacterized protein YciI